MISLIAAVAKNNVVGLNNKLPWHLPKDLRHFKAVTWGKTVLMGRKTFESIFKILGQPLPGRQNAVITRQAGYRPGEFPNLAIYGSFEQALRELRTTEIFVIGGTEMWKMALPLAERMHITHIHETYQGDAFFPDLDWGEWEKIVSEPGEGFEFALYERKTQA